MDEPRPPKHYTKEPWWVVPLGGAAAALVPLIRRGHFERSNLGVGLPEATLPLGVLGTVAAALLVARSHIRSVAWSNVVLWLGILLIAMGACFASILMSD